MACCTLYINLHFLQVHHVIKRFQQVQEITSIYVMIKMSRKANTMYDPIYNFILHLECLIFPQVFCYTHKNDYIRKNSQNIRCSEKHFRQQLFPYNPLTCITLFNDLYFFLSIHVLMCFVIIKI